MPIVTYYLHPHVYFLEKHTFASENIYKDVCGHLCLVWRPRNNNSHKTYSPTGREASEPVAASHLNTDKSDWLYWLGCKEKPGDSAPRLHVSIVLYLSLWLVNCPWLHEVWRLLLSVSKCEVLVRLLNRKIQRKIHLWRNFTPTVSRPLPRVPQP